MPDSSFVSKDPADLTTKEVHGYLLAAVASRPIALASTVDKEGNVNLSPFSFFNVFSANPPLMIFSPARRGRDNTTKHTYENLKDCPEVVINIVNYDIVEQMSLSSTEYDRGVNEFVKSGLTEVASQKIKPPRVKESPVSFECKVNQIIELGDQGGAGNLVFAEVVMIHMGDQYLDREGKLDPSKLQQVARMGGNWYNLANEHSMFEIEKPLSTKGIGVDSLPEAVRNSKVLTGNELGQLGNLAALPSTETLEMVRQMPDFISELADETFYHTLAQNLLRRGEREKALAVLFASS